MQVRTEKPYLMISVLNHLSEFFHRNRRDIGNEECLSHWVESPGVYFSHHYYLQKWIRSPGKDGFREISIDHDDQDTALI